MKESFTEEQLKELGLPCECINWCRADRFDKFESVHHDNCPKRNTAKEARIILDNLLNGIKKSASDTDGIHEDVWPHFLQGLFFLQRSQEMHSHIEADRRDNPERYPVTVTQ